MDYNQLKDTLAPAVKKAAKSKVERQKKEEIKDMTPAKKDKEEKENKSPTYTGDLRDIVNLRKQKAVANELGEFIFEQEERKKAREKGEILPQTKQEGVNYVIDPKELKNLSLEEIIKYKMLSSQGGVGGGSDVLSSLLLLGQGGLGGNNQNQSPSFRDTLVDKIILKWFDEKTEKKENTEEGSFTQRLILEMMNNMVKLQMSQKGDSGEAKMYKEIIEVLAQKGDVKTEVLTEKIRELEIRAAQSDPLGDAKRVIDFLKSFKPLFGGQTSPEGLKHEVELRRMDLQDKKEKREEEGRETRMIHIGDMINENVKTFGKYLGEPAAKAIKKKIEKMMAENPDGENPEEVLPVDLPDDIDLGDLDKIDLDEFIPTPERTPRKKNRFKVYEVAEE